MVDQERLNYLSDKLSKMNEEIIIEVNKDGIDVAYVDVWAILTARLSIFTTLGPRFRKLLRKDLRNILKLNSISV